MSETAVAVKADLWRQLGFFDPADSPKIHVVGVGATGSHIVNTLCSMGIESVVAYDYDNVEVHNLPNQIYRLDDVGKPKVEALQEHIKAKMGFEIEVHNEKVTGITSGGILVLCTDSPESQKEILLNSAKKGFKRVVETRMGIDTGLVFYFDPRNKYHIDNYLKEWYPSNESEESPCNIRAISVMVESIAALAASKIM